MRSVDQSLEKAKNNALKILDDFGIDCPPINPVKIALEMGIAVNFANFPKHNNVSGFFNAKQNAIYVNAAEAGSRMTFTIAHELGHSQLHRDWAESSDYKILYRNQNIIDQKDPKEVEANVFAANLLVPRFLLDKYKKILENSLIGISDLATVFAVSNPVIKFRLKNEYGL
jgi:Zn-dependent peptidase ImmA (M78 family)